MNAAQIAPLAVVLPLLGAALAFVLIRHPNAQRRTGAITLTVTLAVEVVMLASAWANGAQAVNIGGWTAPFGITLVADELAAFMLVVSTIVGADRADLRHLAGHGGRVEDPRDPGVDLPPDAS